MDPNQQKEQFSNAYVQAITAAAGYTLYKPTVDDDSVDWGMAHTGGHGTYRSPRLEFQLKCTSRDVVRDETLAFPLKPKNYNDLRHVNYQVPRILVVVLVPDNIADWIRHSEDSLSLYHCGYWVSLHGATETSNTATVTVSIPRAQQFTVEAVVGMMDRVGQGGLP